MGEAALPVGNVGGPPRGPARAHLHRTRQPAIANAAPGSRAADAAEEGLHVTPTQVLSRSSLRPARVGPGASMEGCSLNERSRIKLGARGVRG